MERMLKGDLYEIESYRSGDGEAEFVLRLNENCHIYEVHFPGNPITPGACLLLMAKELASIITGRELFVRAAKNIKFIAPVVPTNGNLITYSMSYSAHADGEYTFRVDIRDGDKVFSKQSLSMTDKEI